MTNLRQHRKPSTDRSFRTPNPSVEPVSIVKRALAKFCDFKEYEQVINMHRRSVITDEALIADFMSCDVPFHPVIKDDNYRKALALTTKLFKPPPYRPVHYSDLKHYPWTLNTSAEAPFSTDKNLQLKVLHDFKAGKIPNARMTTSNLFPTIIEYNRPIVHLIKEGKQKRDQFLYWNTAHARSHLVLFDDPDKVRSVHGVPKLCLQVELMLLWPYFNFLRKGTTPIAWGYEISNAGTYRIYNEASTHSYRIQTWLALDWSKFDKLARFEIIDDVHSSWQSFMILDDGYIPTSEHRTSTTNPDRISRLWSFMSKAVKFTPIRLPDGSEWKRTHSSIASGLLQTQVLDSWVNAIMLLTCLISLGIEVDEEVFIKLLGDDSLIGLRELIPEEEFDGFLCRLASEALKRFGSILNVKKSKILRTLQGAPFLGYKFNNAIPTRDPLKLLAQLAYPERSWTVDRMAARALGICYASCGQSKLVYDVCKDVYDFCVNVGKATPDPSGYSFLEYLMTVSRIDLSYFPTFEELSANLFNPRRDPKLDEKFWPSDIFLSDY